MLAKAGISAAGGVLGRVGAAVTEAVVYEKEVALPRPMELVSTAALGALTPMVAEYLAGGSATAASAANKAEEALTNAAALERAAADTAVLAERELGKAAAAEATRLGAEETTKFATARVVDTTHSLERASSLFHGDRFLLKPLKRAAEVAKQEVARAAAAQVAAEGLAKEAAEVARSAGAEAVAKAAAAKAADVAAKAADAAAKTAAQAVAQQAAAETAVRTAAVAKLFFTDEELCQLGDRFRIAGNLDEARRWYEKSPNHKTHPGIRKSLKQLEKAIILERYRVNQQAYNVNERDVANNTALHRAAKYGHLKTYARLQFFGASTTINNGESKTPAQYLSRSQEIKELSLRDDIRRLFTQLERSTPGILADRMFIHNARFPDDDTKERMLRELHSLDEVRPLLDLAKLAALGLHNLANRTKFSDEDYDSDNDDIEALSDLQKLSIHLDAIRETVDDIAGVDEAYGVYLPRGEGIYSQRGNSIYFGGSRTLRAESRATMVHELTHFLAYELHDNSGNPYGKTDTANRNRFDLITNDLRQRQHTLDPILRRAFGQNYELHNQCAAELIVRVPQMIIRYQNQAPNGIERLQNQAPELLRYYREVFLVAVREHTLHLERRALQEWPRELFERNRQGDYAPEFRV